MSTGSAHNTWWQIFEVVFGVPLVVAIGLQLAVPVSLPGGLLRWITIPVGVSLVFTGITLIRLARQEFARYNQPTDPGQATSKVITTGVFSISRNPLYLGGVCVLVGIALAANLPWVLLLLLPALAICHYLLIAPEERYLAARFGEEYRAYAARVGRWIGRSRDL